MTTAEMVKRLEDRAGVRSDCDAKLDIDAAERLRDLDAVLRMVEWSRVPADPMCPACGTDPTSNPKRRHAPDCPLAALLEGKVKS